VKFTVTPTDLPEVLVIEHESFGDERGFFAETFRANVFADHGLPPFVQENHSRSSKGVLRGLHLQNDPAAIGKLVRCVRGKIWDVAVDARRGSPRYGKWTGVELSGDDSRMFYLPPGFAHGFYTVSDVADVVYKQTGYYAPEQERFVRWNDPAIGITWPAGAPTLSARDAQSPALEDADVNLVYRG
jgi:dTDP-4-dehydrorhamnose 3,5-epimerase